MSLRTLRTVVTGVGTGLLLVGTAVAATVVAPVGGAIGVSGADGTGAATQTAVTAAELVEAARRSGDQPSEQLAGQLAGPGTDAGAEPPDGAAMVGTGVVDITPNPPEGAVWQTEGCQTGLEDPATLTRRKTGTPDCIYMGGRGLGPSEPITHVDPDNPLEVRSVAITAGGGTAVLTQVDGVYWHGAYETYCERCGSLEIGEDLAEELELDPSAFLIAANHSHNSPDFIGAWGGVPDWYRTQVTEAIRDSISTAVTAAEPAVLEHGEALARDLNTQRRSTYVSAEDAGISWVRAIALEGGRGDAGRELALVATFSAHPVTTGYDDGRGHADWPGRFSQLVRADDEAVGIAFVAGLGNMSTRQGTEATATGLLAAIPATGDGIPTAADVRTAQATFDQPLSNAGLIALRNGFFFDRTQSGPATVEAGPSTERACRSAAPVSVSTAVSAVQLADDVVVTGGPGELFSNLTNGLKELTPGSTVLPLANVNDGLGYIMQSFEEDPTARQGAGFTDAPVEYEEAFSLDACFGDLVYELTAGLVESLRADE